MLLFPALEVSAKSEKIFDGTLGPIRIKSTGVDAAAQGKAKREMRKTLTPLFSQKDDRLYRVSVTAQMNAEEMTRENFGGIDGNHKSWQVLLEVIELKPGSGRVGYSEFVVLARDGVVMATQQAEASRYFPEYLARRSRIALKQMGGEDQERQLKKLSADMLRLRGVGPVGVALDATLAAVIGGSKTVVESAAGLTDAMTDPEVMAAAHEAMVEAAPSQSLDAVVSEHNREMDAIYAQKMAEAKGSVASASSEQARQQYTNSVPATASTTGTSAVVTAPSTSGRDTGSGYGSDNEDSSTTSASNAKAPCVAHSESGQEMPNVPDRYCRKVFADYTGNVEFGLDEYSSEFMDESHSVDSAEETLAFKLLQKAKKQCSRRGYDRVHHDETFEYNEVAVRVNECKENNRMGSTFYLCGGTASFICAR